MSRPPKICITTPEYPPDQWGGLARTVWRVARHGRDLGLDVHVAHFTVKPDQLVLLDENRETQAAYGITVHRIGLGKERIERPDRDLWQCPHTLTLQMMYQSLERLFRDETFDLFHSFFLHPVGYVTGLLSRRMQRPTIATIVGNDVKKYIFSPEKAAVLHSGLENATRVVGLSQELVDVADSLVPVKAKAAVIYNAVELPDQPWRPRPGPVSPFVVGCAGIFKYEKGLPYLLKAMHSLTAKHAVQLEIRGYLRASEQETYREMLSRTGIGEAVRLLDPLPHDGISGWLTGLDAFVLPSLSEGCPNILMEAMASGVPSVATRTGANEELMEDGVSGLLVPWGDSAALTVALDRLFRDPSHAAALGNGARERMRLFSAARELRAWQTVYQELIDLW